MRKYLDGYVPPPPVFKWVKPPVVLTQSAAQDHTTWTPTKEENERYARYLAQSFLDRADEDWTYIDPEDVKRLARAVLDK